MKKVLIYSVLVIIVLFSLLQLKVALEKPEIIYENSLDNNQDLTNIDELNQGFTLNSEDNTGLLIVHGLGASPYQTRELADYLSEKGVTISSVRLSGHGTTLKDLEKKEWQDWYVDVEQSYNELKNKTNKTYVLGISLGSALTLNLAAKEDLDGIIVIAPPIYLQSEKTKYAFLKKYFAKYHYFGVDETQIGYSYENLPIKTIVEFIDVSDESKNNLNQIEESIFIIQSHKDILVKPESAKYVFDNIKSLDKYILFVNSVGHSVIRVDDEDTPESIEERQNIFIKIYEFIDDHEN
jgi:carboxylesterase